MSEVTEILRLRCRRAARTSLSAQDDNRSTSLSAQDDKTCL